MIPGSLSRTLDDDGLVVGSADTIYTFTGRTIRPLDPNPDDIVIEDIAHALSQQCRFTGHTSRFSSVAEHSVRVSWMVPRELALEALLHDASEAYLADIARPVKKAPGFAETYLKYEAQLERAIATCFGLPEREQMHPEIKKADQYALEAEVACFCHPSFRKAMGVTRLGDVNGRAWQFQAKPNGWLPGYAERVFLAEYDALTGADL
jgi:hypothetical protein